MNLLINKTPHLIQITMNKKLLILAFLLQALLINAQQVITTAGNYNSNTSGSLSWTMGEGIIDTYTSTSVILTQGFQQSKLTVTAVPEISGNSSSIIVYPNPTEDFVSLKVNTGLGLDFKYQLYDLNGKLLTEQKLTSSETVISFRDRVPGTYLLKLLNKDQVLKIFKINKR